jgi:CRP/FNR family transcriptional regulator, cyclic AMP receptor protein
MKNLQYRQLAIGLGTQSIAVQSVDTMSADRHTSPALAHWYQQQRLRLVSSELERSINSFAPAVAALARAGRVQRFRKGVRLIAEGERGDTLFVILKGQLKCYAQEANGREMIYGLLGPGEYVGEMSLDGGPRSASVVTLEPTTCAMLGREDLQQFVRAQPDFALELIDRLIARARRATDIARSMALQGNRCRLEQYLAANAVTHEDGQRWLPPKITHQAIAQSIGCSREAVTRLLHELQTEGKARVVQRRIAWLG